MSLSPHSPSILIADDEASTRLLLGPFLSKRGYQVYLAEDGREAVEQVRRHRPDFLLIDQSMPQRSGLEVVSLLKIAGVYPLMYTLLLTGYTSEEDQEKAFAAGVDCFLPKPCDILSLVDKLEHGTEVREQQKAQYLLGDTNCYLSECFLSFVSSLESRVQTGELPNAALLIIQFKKLGDSGEPMGTGELGFTAMHIEKIEAAFGPHGLLVQRDSQSVAVLMEACSPEEFQQSCERAIEGLSQLPGADLEQQIAGAAALEAGQVGLKGQAESALAIAAASPQQPLVFTAMNGLHT